MRGDFMKFPEPRLQDTSKLSLTISKKTEFILQYYAKYSKIPVNELVDDFMKNLLEDEGFIEWAKVQRPSKKSKSYIFGEE